jgi:hypothetical protein
MSSLIYLFLAMFYLFFSWLLYAENCLYFQHIMQLILEYKFRSKWYDTMIGHVRRNMCISWSNMIVWRVTIKFRSYYGFYVYVVISLEINECMYYSHQMINNSVLTSFDVAYLVFNVMS